MSYRQITAAERYTLAVLRQQGLHPAAIARVLGRHRSTIGRELRRNRTAHDGCYRPQLADWYARSRRSRSRRNRRFGAVAWRLVTRRLQWLWSPEQIAGRLRAERRLTISHETIYRYLWADKRRGGTLYIYRRGARKQRRKRYGAYDSRGRLAGKRPITARPHAAAARTRVGHWEADTLLGAGQAEPCLLTMVDRKTGYVALGKLQIRRAPEVNARARHLIRAQRRPVRTITADNGTEFHDYVALEHATGARFFCATPLMLGSGALTRTPTGCCGSTSPRGRA